MVDKSHLYNSGIPSNLRAVLPTQIVLALQHSLPTTIIAQCDRNIKGKQDFIDRRGSSLYHQSASNSTTAPHYHRHHHITPTHNPLGSWYVQLLPFHPIDNDIVLQALRGGEGTKQCYIRARRERAPQSVGLSSPEQHVSEQLL